MFLKLELQLDLVLLRIYKHRLVTKPRNVLMVLLIGKAYMVRRPSSLKNPSITQTTLEWLKRRRLTCKTWRQEPLSLPR